MSDAAYECAMNTSFTKDGVKIEGHDYTAEIALIDLDTGRTYLIDHCDNCGHVGVTWTDKEPKHFEEYPVKRTVGG